MLLSVLFLSPSKFVSNTLNKSPSNSGSKIMGPGNVVAVRSVVCKTASTGDKPSPGEKITVHHKL